MKLLSFLVGVLVLLPSLALGADGDSCDSDTGKLTHGNYKTQACVNLCDGKAAADSNCGTSYDLDDAGGIPDLIIFEYEDVGADCSSTPDYTITTSPEADGAPAYALDSSAVILNPSTNRVIIKTKEAPPDRYLVVAIADDASCSNVDLRMHLLNHRD